ncbi:MAG: hypothetical protein R3327_03965 [Nitrosopumilaceae archaeon]|nr:hypothetical protein [Nitrosopumilaceae archaeon]
MATFDSFCQSLEKLIHQYEHENTLLKVERDVDFDIVKIFGEKLSALSRAKNGLNDVTELAYTTAEHHPYWNLLYNSTEIAHTILEKWDDKLTPKEIDDIKWSIDELTKTLEKIKTQN